MGCKKERKETGRHIRGDPPHVDTLGPVRNKEEETK